MSNRLAGLGFSLAIVTFTCVTAHAEAPKTLEALTPYDIDPSRLLPPPPVDGSEANKAEIAEMHRIIAARTPARLAQAKWDDDHEDPSLFYATIGGGFDLKTLPATADLLAGLVNDQAVAASAAKKFFARKRPWALDASIPTCDPNDKPLTGYPSGHAVLAYSVGTVLASLMPEKAQAIQARAADFAFSREVCGSHYASDTEASHVLGVTLANAFLAKPQMAGKLAAAKAELQAAHFTAP